MDPALLARATLQVVDAGSYDGPAGAVELGGAVRAAIDGTRVVTPHQATALAAQRPRDLGASAAFEVTDESTVEACRRLAAPAGVTALNFANAVRAGGGFLGGAMAQEEDLCRCSALYRCLERAPELYRANRAAGSSLYTDHAIWSPAVPFFRAADDGFLPRPFVASVITSPAPNTNHAGRDELAGLDEAVHRRARQVLAIAAANGPATIVLGAWGCGAFGGDPRVVADAFGKALDEGFARAFERVVFAVLVRGVRDAANLAVFRRRFAP